MSFSGHVPRGPVFALIVGAWIACVFSSVRTSALQTQPGSVPTQAPVSARATLDKYCVTCHNQKLRTAGLALDTLDLTNPGANPEVWEKVIAKLQQGSMPPAGRPRPDAATYHAVAASLEDDVDREDRRGPSPQPR